MAVTDNRLGAFLKDRRTKLDPARLGLPSVRRRTPGVRREEVAQIAGVSTTWYTWLEQGRGGAPSVAALERIADALLLTAAERELLSLLAYRRPSHCSVSPEAATLGRLQRVLNSLVPSPAFVRTPPGDVLVWNEAAAAVLTDYGQLAPEDRNVLRLVFCDPRVRANMPNWEEDARVRVARFRLEMTRAGRSERSDQIVDEISRSSPEFRAMWRDNDVDLGGGGTKSLDHPIAGRLSLEYSSFLVHDRQDLTMVIYTPTGDIDEERILGLLASRRTHS